MRTRYIVSYDISDPKRLRRVFRTMKGYGDPLQFSVFQCDLSPSEKILMIEALSAIIHHRDDQVLLINIGPSEHRGRHSVDTIGRALPEKSIDRVAVIV
jgi:CRISPR-associated protein Cas2